MTVGLARSILPEALRARLSERGRFSLLVFSRTTGHYRHDSIPAGIDMFRRLGASYGFDVLATEDQDAFNQRELSRHAAVVWLNTGGDVLDGTGRAAFANYIRHGGGYVGIHSASATEYDWPFYGGLVGAYFDSHPDVTPARIEIAEGDHPSTHGLPSQCTRVDEWYDFRSQPGIGVQVLVNVDGSSYPGSTRQEMKPISWWQSYEGGQAWYTAMGHTVESYDEPFFQQHVLGGVVSVLPPAGRGAQASRDLTEEPESLDTARRLCQRHES